MKTIRARHNHKARVGRCGNVIFLDTKDGNFPYHGWLYRLSLTPTGAKRLAEALLEAVGE